jgi:hypothetical protein
VDHLDRDAATVSLEERVLGEADTAWDHPAIVSSSHDSLAGDRPRRRVPIRVPI